MAKRQCDPTSGSIGLQVYVPGRNGQVVRIRAIPANPQTAEQVDVRALLSTEAKAWRALTEVQRASWKAAAMNFNSKSRLGQSGPLTGEQLFVKVNCNLRQVGEPPVIEPPVSPTFDANVVQSLTITNTTGTIAIKLAASGTSDAFNLIAATPPLSQGRGRPYGLNQLGELPEVQTGYAVITTLYVAKFGVPAVGKKIFVRSHQMSDGYVDGGALFSAIVPASS